MKNEIATLKSIAELTENSDVKAIIASRAAELKKEARHAGDKNDARELAEMVKPTVETTIVLQKEAAVENVQADTVTFIEEPLSDVDFSEEESNDE